MVDYLERNELSKDGAAPDKNEGCQDQESPFGHKKKKVKSQKGKGQKSKVSRHTSPVAQQPLQPPKAAGKTGATAPAESLLIFDF
jgi:hypothetical protein